MNKINAGNRVLAEKTWHGYSLEELRYRRALNEVAIAIEKDKLMRQVSETLPRNETGTSMLSRAIGALTYMDYVILAFKLMTRAARLYRTLKRR